MGNTPLTNAGKVNCKELTSYSGCKNHPTACGWKGKKEGGRCYRPRAK